MWMRSRPINSPGFCFAQHRERLCRHSIGLRRCYSAKSYTTAGKTARAQARFSPESGQASYHGQGRLVPSDQLADAKAVAHREALRNQPVRPDASDAFVETESRLTDTIKNGEGVSSKSASRKELEDIAGESKDQKFNAEDHGVSANSAIKTEYMLKQALKAGYTTAAITVAFQLAPEIYKAIDFLIKHGELNIQQIKRMGTKGISAGAEGFLRGSISSSLLIMCEKRGFLERPSKASIRQFSVLLLLLSCKR